MITAFSCLRQSLPISRSNRINHHLKPILLHNNYSFSNTTTTTNDNKDDDGKTTAKRRSRKRNTSIIKSSDNSRNDSTELFKALRSDGTPQSFDEYVSSASLSPWVPTPEVVGRRALEIAKCSSQDIHCDLGCGDGRMNFLAINYPYYLSKSVGIDNNAELIATATKRLSKIHPRPDITFLDEDLLSKEFMELNDDDGGNMLGECTVVTMHFATEGLMKIKPLLEQKLNKNCRVITIGYEIDGWEMEWSEVMLDLPIHLYNMHDQEFTKDFLKSDDGDDNDDNNNDNNNNER